MVVTAVLGFGCGSEPIAERPAPGAGDVGVDVAGRDCDLRSSDAAAPALRYVEAVNDGDLGGLVGAFAQDGTVRDVSRNIEGHDAIREWADTEVMGGSLRVLGCTPAEGGVRLLVHWAPSGAEGWRAQYTFETAEDRITLAHLQYA